MRDMKTSRPSSSALATGQPFHTSSRSDFSMNVDPATGLCTQVMSTAKLEMRWIAGELRLEYRAAQARSEGHASRRLQQRAGRGAS